MTYKLVYLARRAAAVSRADWPRTWKSHAVFASRFPSLEASIDWMRYCNRIEEVALPGLSQDHDGVAVAAGGSLEGLTGTGFSEADRALIDADELRVFDRPTPEFTFYCREAVIRDGPIGEAAVFSFLARKPGLTHAEFEERWSGDNAGIAREAVAGVAGLTRYVHNHPVHDPLPAFPFDGIAEAWFASADDAVRAFEGSTLASLRLDLSEFCDFTRGVILLTSVCHRWPKA